MSLVMLDNSLMFPNGYKQFAVGPSTTNAYPNSNLGSSNGDPYGYGWTNGSNDRAVNTTYTAPGRPIVWTFAAPNTWNETWIVYIDGMPVRNVNNYGTTSGFTMIVPAGRTYKVSRGAGNGNTLWCEW